jgi:hypothetical protein
MKIESESFDFHGALASGLYRNPNLSACDLKNIVSGRKRYGKRIGCLSKSSNPVFVNGLSELFFSVCDTRTV